MVSYPYESKTPVSDKVQFIAFIVFLFTFPVGYILVKNLDPVIQGIFTGFELIVLAAILLAPTGIWDRLLPNRIRTKTVKAAKPAKIVLPKPPTRLERKLEVLVDKELKGGKWAVTSTVESSAEPNSSAGLSKKK